MSEDLYSLFNASRNDDLATLKRCCRKATLVAHSDKGGSDADFTLVKDAARVLLDPGQRAV